MQHTQKHSMKKMDALQKQLDEIREKLKSNYELIEILIKENEALKLRLDYEKREAAKAHEIVPRAYA
jgi:regulator of replication initiation timing